MKSIKVLALTALLGGSAFAGDKAPVVVDPVCTVPFTATVSVGYETDYIFRGVTYGEDAPWMGIDTVWALSDTMSFNVGTWYINSTNEALEFDELDVYAFLKFPLWIFDASVGGTWYYYPEGIFDDNGEASVGLGYDLGLFQLASLAAYDFELEGWYFELAGKKTIALLDCLDLGLTAGVSYVDDYAGTNGWNHAFARAALIYKLTSSASLSAYIGGNFPLEAIDGIEEDKAQGGASLSVSF